MLRLRLPLLLSLTFAASSAWAQGSQIDIIPQSPSFSPATVPVGGTVTLSGSVQATGGFVGNVFIEFELTTSPGGIGLGVGGTQVFFNGGTVSTYSLAVTLPGNITPGAYWVRAVADRGNVVPENNETNNTVLSLQTLQVIGVDLVAVSLVGAPTAVSGQPYPVTIRIQNLSQLDANGFVYAYYSQNQPTGVPLLQIGPINLAANQTIMRQDTLTFPPQTGTTSLTMWVNADLRVPEANLQNNAVAIQVAVDVARPDLRASLDTFNGIAEIGQNLSLSGNVLNFGDIPSGRFEYGYFLSIDPVVTTADRELGRFTTSASVAAGDFEAVQDNLLLPLDLVAGNYFVAILADPADVIAESDEGNNASNAELLQLFEPELLITTASLPDGIVGEAYGALLSARGGAFPPTWAVTSGGLPPGLLLDAATGTIQGRPSEAGTFPFSIRATSGAATSEAPFTVTVAPATQILTIADALPVALAGRPYATQLIVTGGTGPYRFTSPDLPAWLTLSSEGVLQGTPPEPGTIPFSVNASDAEGRGVEVTLTLVVRAPSDVLRIETPPLVQAVVGQPYCGVETVRLAASGGEPPYTWSAMEGLPPGISLSSEGALCGTPTTVGDFSFVARVQDINGRFTTDRLSLTVVADTDLIVLPQTFPDTILGANYEVSLEVQGGQAPYTFEISQGNLPPGITLRSDARIIGAASELGTFTFVIRAVDSTNAATSAARSITVVLRDGFLQASDSGCSCRQDPGSRGVAGWLWLLAIPMLARRRR